MSISDEFNIDYLILNGAAEVSAYDPEDGKFLYSFTEKIMDVAPNLYKQIAEYFYDGVMSLWNMGIVYIDMDEATPIVYLPDREFAETVFDLLDERDQIVLTTLLQNVE